VFASSVQTAILGRRIGIEGLEERMLKGANPDRLHDLDQLLLHLGREQNMLKKHAVCATKRASQIKVRSLHAQCQTVSRNLDGQFCTKTRIFAVPPFETSMESLHLMQQC
jgi:hypothetical protein